MTSVKQNRVSLSPLPIDEHVDRIVTAVGQHRGAVIVAPPGSGKTTRVPPALLSLGRVILLQPRRVAARALARRIAAEQRWTVGRQIGWHIRFERNFSRETRLLVATEGILTARLQSDPLLSDFDVVVLDEFHERSIHADLALALARQAAVSRDDLAVVVMSATIDAGPVAQFLDAPVIEIEARPYPIELRYRPDTTIGAAVREVIAGATGHVLCFLPGGREIERAAAEIGAVDADVLPLHGTLTVDAQERALAPSERRKVILATNVAETSLTVEGVTDVIDSGLHKILRYDTDTAVDHLVTERISADSAGQRAGRAGRTAPGRAVRLWDERTMLAPQREPEVRRIDLTAPVLDIIAWGGDPKTFEWFERPVEGRIDAALDLLRQLGAIEGRKLTAIGEAMRNLPLPPRLARMVIAAGGSREAVSLALEISEGVVREEALRTIVSAVEREGPTPEPLAGAALAGYPDRVAVRREPKSPRLLLATGTGATLAREIEHTPGDYFVVLEIRGEFAHRVMAIEREWLEPNRTEVVHEIDEGRVRARRRDFYGAILLHEQGIAPDPIESERLLEEHRRNNVDPALQRRLAFAGLGPDAPRHRLDALAPLTLPLPSGRSARLEYRDDGSVLASAKLQELFGLAESPRIGPQKTPVTFALLAPNGRPVQLTRDLRNFWNTTYQEVRKELRARYPKHPWPEDPWTAKATHRTKGR
jgi:ATP-dependent helicase HrpB